MALAISRQLACIDGFVLGDQLMTAPSLLLSLPLSLHIIPHYINLNPSAIWVKFAPPKKKENMACTG